MSADKKKIIGCPIYPCILVRKGYVKDDINDTKLLTCCKEMRDCGWWTK